MQSLALILSLLICVCFPAVASAQNTTDVQEPVASPPSPTITTIAQSEQIGEYVRGLFQDRDGNHWFSTSNGVCRYDGKSLTYFTRRALQILQDENGAMWFAGTVDAVSRYENGRFTNYTVANGLSHNRVWSMMMDSAGTIWVGTKGGVCRFDGESFVPFPIPRAEVENPYSNISPLLAFGMAEDQDGNLWFGMDGEGVRKFDGESFTTYTTKDGLAGNNVRSVYADRRGRMWFGTANGGVSCYDGTAFRNFTEKDGLNNNNIVAILEDKAGNMWFSTLGAGACRYDGETFTAFREDHGLTINGLPAHAHVLDMFEDKDEILWFGCSDGLWRLDGESFINVTENGPWPTPAQEPALLRFEYREGPHGMHNAGVRAIFEDGGGNVWFGTHLDGLARFDGREYAYFDVHGGSRGLNRVWRIMADEGGTPWFRTGRGVARFDGERIVHHALRDALQADDWTLETGNLWFAGSDPSGNDEREGEIGIFRYDGEMFTFLPIPVPEDLRSSKDFEVVGMWRGNGARMWLATWDAVLGYDGETLTVIDNERLGHTDATGYLHIKCMLEDSRGRVWIGNNGIGVILVEGDTITNFTQRHGVGRRDHRSGGSLTPAQPGDAPEGAPSFHRVFTIGEDAGGNIWFGTSHQGAWRYDGTSLQQFTEADGLDVGHVATFFTDRRGDVWVGGKGVYKFNGESFDRIH